MKIYYLNGEKTGGSVDVQAPGAGIGRETDNDIQLLVGGVSRFHARIDCINGVWSIRDLGSTNGTKVNGRLIQDSIPLPEGSILEVGDQILRFGEDPAHKTDAAAVATASGIVFNAPASGVSASPSVVIRSPGAVTPENISESSKTRKSLHLESDQQNIRNRKIETGTLKSPSVNLTKDQIDDNIFGKPGSENIKSSRAGGQSERKHISNLLFYTIVIALAVVCIALFIKFYPGAGKEGKLPVNIEHTANQKNFVLVYERQTVSPDNVFRFALTVENNRGVITLDDLKYSRRFQKTLNSIEPTALKNLETAVRKTDFIKLEQETLLQGSGNDDDFRRILLAYDDKLNEISVRNTYARSSFLEVEKAVEDFVDAYGLKTISIPVSQMKSEAKKNFENAEQLYLNYEARPENLRNAIVRYQLVMDLLAPFEPKPEEWDMAQRRLAEAQNKMNKIIEDAQYNVELLSSKKQYSEAISECTKLMEIVGPDSTSYQKIREIKIRFEKLLMGNK